VNGPKGSRPNSSDRTAGGRRPERLLSPEQVAEQLSVPAKSVYGYIYNQGLPAAKVGRHLRIRPSDLEAWIEERMVGTERGSATTMAAGLRHHRSR